MLPVFRDGCCIFRDVHFASQNASDIELRLDAEAEETADVAELCALKSDASDFFAQGEQRLSLEATGSGVATPLDKRPLDYKFYRLER